MKVVLIDMDGVLVDSTDTWLAEYRAISGDSLYPNQLKTYNFDQYAKHPKLVWKALSSGNVFRKSWPCRDAISGFQHFCDLFDVYVVTYVHESVPDGAQAKTEWLAHHCPDFPSQDIIFTKHKHMVRGDYLIGENTTNLDKWLEAHPNGKGFLIDQPYNKNWSHIRCKRVNTVLDALMIAQEDL